MLTQETKRHIDAARQVLVGVVPNPTSQIDQITNALIYKFMDDMDQSAITHGGKPSFFVGDLEPYAWTRLMDSRIGNQERMNIYSEALIKFSQSEKLPALFRDIFKSAFLPYRSPEVLGLFLKEIAYFDYKHSEELGNAYEYLLSIMSSQGDAGQFRTPRHIIDFIVEVINPTKDDKILDPACGTAGFLISAYKHILFQHDGQDARGKPNKEKPLTPDDRKKLFSNFEGYDIDPGMVRIAQVNMYLHKFRNPKIVQYDSLSMEERWGDKFDVILANPPFMSPKGGIKPHNKFGIDSSRSEVLFVDYIMNHLRPKGRAGIIVPEGIIFQSGTAYKQLRKNLVEDGLYAVVSLPSGVFQPYSGVKTSILLFNNDLAKKSKELLFIKIENDGFDLGAQRRPSTKNDLPQALEILKTWQDELVIPAQTGIQSLSIPKSKIAEIGDYNLSADRYRVATDYSNAKWPMVDLQQLCEITTGKKDVNQGNPNGEYPFFTCAKENTFIDEFSFDAEALLIAGNGDVGSVKYYKGKFDAYQRTYVLSDFKKVNAKYLYQVLDNSLKENLQLQKLGNTMPYIKLGMLQTFKVPLPPLEIQEQIVKELDGFSAIIAGAKQITQNWKPKIATESSFENFALGEIARVINGRAYKQEELLEKGKYPVLRVGNFFSNRDWYYSDFELEKDKYCQRGDLLYAWSASFGPRIWEGDKAIYHYHIWKIEPSEKILKKYLYYFLETETENIKSEGGRGVAMIHITKGNFEQIKIPLPPIEIQRKIVEGLEGEQALVESAKKLIAIYEQKTKDTIAKLWSDD